TAGSAGGTAGVGAISNITLGQGVSSTVNNFGELPPASLGGVVYYDANNDGLRAPRGIGLATPATLTRTHDRGTSVSRTTTSNPTTGAYSFTSLRPGIYAVTAAVPASYLQGKNNVGSVNDTKNGTLQGTNGIGTIALQQGNAGGNYNFGEIR